MGDDSDMEAPEIEAPQDNHQFVLLGRTLDRLRSKTVVFSSTPSEPMLMEAASSIRAGCGNERVMVWEMRGADLPTTLNDENDAARKRLAKMS